MSTDHGMSLRAELADAADRKLSGNALAALIGRLIDGIQQFLVNGEVPTMHTRHIFMLRCMSSSGSELWRRSIMHIIAAYGATSEDGLQQLFEDCVRYGRPMSGEDTKDLASSPGGLRLTVHPHFPEAHANCLHDLFNMVVLALSGILPSSLTAEAAAKAWELVLRKPGELYAEALVGEEDAWDRMVEAYGHSRPRTDTERINNLLTFVSADIQIKYKRAIYRHKTYTDTTAPYVYAQRVIYEYATEADALSPPLKSTATREPTLNARTLVTRRDDHALETQIKDWQTKAARPQVGGRAPTGNKVRGRGRPTMGFGPD